ncbi:MAG: hypothetical protein PWQ95_1974 [Thermococcaceae archaeon]|nr:hypothetical protein [Thermococcaceae archaeon]
MVSVSLLLLYLSFLFGVVVGIKTKSCHPVLAILVFSSAFVAGAEYNSSYIAIISWFALSALFSYLFYLGYVHPRVKHERDESVGDAIMGYLLGLGILLILKLYGAGWILSLLVSYWVFYLMLIIDHGKNRQAFYILKIPWVVFSIGALIEEFGLQKDLVPFLVVYAVVFILWLKFDLPRLWRPPRIT